MPATLPTYYCRLSAPEHGIREIALVDSPAIERGWVAMRAKSFLDNPNNRTLTALQSTRAVRLDEVKRELTGPLVIPDQLIFRVDADTGKEYNIVFTADVIRAIRDDFMAKRQMSDLNIMHSSAVAPAHLVEWWTVDENKGGGPGFEDLPVGTLMVTVKITDPPFWNDNIATQKLRGFSLEGAFEHVDEAAAQDAQLTTTSDTTSLSDKIMGIFDRILQKTAPPQKQTVSPLQNLKLKLSAMQRETAAGQRMTVLGQKGVRMEVHVSPTGLAAEHDAAALSYTPLATGRYRSDFNGGRWLVVEEGKPAQLEKLAQVPYNIKDSAEVLVIDDETGEAWLQSAPDAELVPAPDKEYTLDDDTVIKVQSGKVMMEQQQQQGQQPTPQHQPQPAPGQQPTPQGQAQLQADPATQALLQQLLQTQAHQTEVLQSMTAALQQVNEDRKTTEAANQELSGQVEHIKKVLSYSTTGKELNMRSDKALDPTNKQALARLNELDERQERIRLLHSLQAETLKTLTEN